MVRATKILLFILLPLSGMCQHHMMSILSNVKNTGVPTYQSSATLTASAAGVSAGGTFTVACPATVNQYDILFAVVTTNQATGGITCPAGWTEITDNSSTLSTVVCWKRAAGDEDGTNITFTTTNAITTTNGYSGTVHRFSGCTYSGTPYQSYSASGAAAVLSLSVPSIYVITNQLAVTIYVQGDDTAINTSSATEQTQQYNESTTTGTDYRHALYTTTSGESENAFSILTVSYEYQRYIQFVLIP